MLTAGNGAAGSYATVGGEPASNTAGATYGNPGIQPLIGGSGGAGNNFTGGHGGGAGGGAILIAATGTITVNGTINVNGGERVGGAGGSGGAIRLVASTVAGSGALTAQGGSGSHAGGLGRIRVEAKTNNLAGTGTPPYSFLLLQDEQQAVLNPNPPSIRPVTLGGVAIPPEPLAGATPDMQLSQSGTALLVLEGRNIPTNSTVRVRVVPLIGPPTEFVTNSAASGDETSSTWQVNINVAGGISTIQARAVLP